jgi:hypothetical protein
VVEVYVDEARIGCGYRRFVVLSIGRKWALLFHAPTLHQVKFDRGTLATSARSIESAPTAVATIIRRNLKTAKRFVLKHSPRAAKLALSVITKQKEQSP